MPSNEFMQRYAASVPQGGTASTPTRSSKRMNFVESALWGVAGSIPWYDEIGARLDSWVLGVDYDKRREEYLADKAAAKEDHPYAFIGGELAGAFIPGAGVVGKGKKVAMLSGAAYGALYGSGAAEDGGLEDRLMGGLIGTGTGALGGYLVEAVAMPVTRWAGAKVGGYIRRGSPAKVAAHELPSGKLNASLDEVADDLSTPKPKAKAPAKVEKGALSPDTSLGPKPAAVESKMLDELDDGALLTVRELLGAPEAAAKAVAKRLGKMTTQAAEKLYNDIKQSEIDGTVVNNPHFRSLLKIDLTGTKLSQDDVIRAAGIFEDAIEALAKRAGQRKRTVKGMDAEVGKRIKKGITLSELEDAYNRSQNGFVNVRLAQHTVLTAAAKVVRLREELLPDLFKGVEGAREKLAEELTDAAHRLVFAKGIMSNAGRDLGLLSHGVTAKLVDVADDAYGLGAKEIGERVNASLGKLADDDLKALLASVRNMADAQNLERILMHEGEAEAFSNWRRAVGSVSLWLRSNALTPATFAWNVVSMVLHAPLRGTWSKNLAANALEKAGRLDEAMMLRLETELVRGIRWEASTVGMKAMLKRVQWEFWSEVENIAGVGWGKGVVVAKARMKRGTMLESGYTPPNLREAGYADKPRLNIRDIEGFNAKNEARLEGGGAFANLVYHLEKARAVTANTVDALGGASMKLFTAAPDDMGREYIRVTEGLAQSAREAFREAQAKGLPREAIPDYVRTRARELATMPTAQMMEKIEASLVTHGELVGEAAFLEGLHRKIAQEADEVLFMDGPQTVGGKVSSNFLSWADHMGIVLPYVRTPIRLFERGLVDYGPFAGLSKTVRDKLAKGGIEAEIEKARIEIGMRVFNTGLVLGLAGGITATNGGFNNSGNLDAGPPSRLNLPGGGFVEIGRLDPFSLTVGIGALVGQAFREGYKHGTEYDQTEALRAAASTAYFAAQDSILSKSYLKGLQDLLGVFDGNSPEQGLSQVNRVLQNAAARFIPLGGIGRQINDTFRTSSIESVGWVDTLLRSIPGAGYGMAPRIDALGDEVKARHVGMNVGNANLTEGQPISPVKAKLRELGINISTIRKADPDGFELTSEELSEVRRIRAKEATNSNGQTMEEALAELFDDPWFNALPTKDAKRTAIVDAMREFNKPAYELLAERNPKFASKKRYTKSLVDYMQSGLTRREARGAALEDVAVEGLPAPE